MKHKTFLVLALSALLLTACSAPAAESAAPTPAAYESQAPAAVSVGKPLHHLNSGGTAPQIGITDSAAYLPMKFGCILLATKIDFATAQQEILCNADGCTHTDETCPAFMAADDDALSQYYTGGLVAAGDRLYWFISGGASPVNVRVDVSAPDGSDRHTIIENGSMFQLDCAMSMNFTDSDALYLATSASGLVRLEDTGLTPIFPLNDGHPTSENPLYAQGSTPRCMILGCWQDMAVFACTPSLSGSGTGLMGVHADGNITDLGTYHTAFSAALHEGKIYHIPGSGNQAETIEITDLATQSTETLPLPAGSGWNNHSITYGEGPIGLSRDEVNYAWNPGSDTAVELTPTWCKDTAVARSPVIYAENGTTALVKVSDHAASVARLTPEGIPYQRQQPIRELALIPLQDLFSGRQNWTSVTMLDGVLFG